jgi:DNA-directed RNA polymerase specialized sigma24 family protein
VFIRAMRALPSFEMRGAPFIAWLLRIAHNIAINYMKQRSRRKEMFLQYSTIASYDATIPLTWPCNELPLMRSLFRWKP